MPEGRAAAHDEVRALLAWHANGTLEAAERTRVERHLEECAACREELGLYRGVGEAVHHTRDATWEPPADQLDRLLDALPAEDRFGPSAVASLRRWWEAVTAPTRWVLVAQTALAFVLAVLLVRAPEPRFQTLTSSEAGDAVAARLEVAFAPEVPESELRALLLSAGASIVRGPSPRGVYGLALDEGSDVPAVVAALRRDARVRLAEPLGDPRR